MHIGLKERKERNNPRERVDSRLELKSLRQKFWLYGLSTAAEAPLGSEPTLSYPDVVWTHFKNNSGKR